jgi:hypothetical protein
VALVKGKKSVEGSADFFCLSFFLTALSVFGLVSLVIFQAFCFLHVNVGKVFF